MAGDVLSFHVFGKVIVVLNSLKTNKDLLEKRADIYSDRIVIPIIEMYAFSNRVFTGGVSLSLGRSGTGWWDFQSTPIRGVWHASYSTVAFDLRP